MQPNDDRSRWMPRLLALVLLAITFAGGVVIGVAGDRMLLLRDGRVLPREGMQVATSRIVRAMDRELDLTQEQRQKIEAILEGRKARIGTIWAGVRPAVREEIDRSNDEIAAQLTPEQEEAFRRILERWERRMERLVGPRDDGRPTP